ncbi:MAG: hypothetical protein MUF72_07925 [Elainella sp. Prado103]|nr:hypothetical protein [Elainella sp. Prado103]
MDILDQYTTLAPSIRETIDIFKGEWSSRLPTILGDAVAGGVDTSVDVHLSPVIQADYQRQLNQLEQQLSQVKASCRMPKTELRRWKPANFGNCGNPGFGSKRQ